MCFSWPDGCSLCHCSHVEVVELHLLQQLLLLFMSHLQDVLTFLLLLCLLDFLQVGQSQLQLDYGHLSQQVMSCSLTRGNRLTWRYCTWTYVIFVMCPPHSLLFRQNTWLCCEEVTQWRGFQGWFETSCSVLPVLPPVLVEGVLDFAPRLLSLWNEEINENSKEIMRKKPH